MGKNMAQKEELLSRLDDLTLKMKTLDKDPNKAGEIKKTLVDAVKKCGTGYGKIADHLTEQIIEMKSMLGMVSDVKRSNYTTVVEFVESLHNCRDQALNTVGVLRQAIEELSEEVFAPDKNAGSTGTRSKFKALCTDTETGDSVEITAAKAIEMFVNSNYFEDVVEVRETLASAFRKALKDNNLEVVDEPRSSDNFFSLYRMCRPSNIKKIAEARTERGISADEAKQREADRKAAAKKALEEAKEKKKKDKENEPAASAE